MRTAIALIVLLFATPVWAEGWICIGDQMTGFKYDATAKKWVSTQFSNKHKYIIRRPNKDDFTPEESKWVVGKFGLNNIVSWCEEVNKGNWIQCNGLGGQFKFQTMTLRFIRIYFMGYGHAGTKEYPDEKADTPFMEIGTCTKF